MVYDGFTREEVAADRADRQMRRDAARVPQLEARIDELTHALTEIRKWVGDGEFSEDVGCTGYFTGEYREVISLVDTAIAIKGPADGGLDD